MLKKIIKFKKPQQLCIDGTLKEFETENRANFVLPTGVGKTITSFGIIEEYIDKGTVLFLVPNISLASQTKDELLKFTNLKDTNVFIYSSESDELKHKDIFTKESTFTNFLTSKLSKKIVISTYSSSGTVKNIIDKLIHKVSLSVYDEFHRVAGDITRDNEKKFQSLIQDNNIKKYLFMSASPKIEEDYPNIENSSNNTNLFGKNVYTMVLREAIDQGYVTDYNLNFLAYELSEQEYISLQNFVSNYDDIDFEIVQGYYKYMQFVKVQDDYLSIPFFQNSYNMFVFKEMVEHFNLNIDNKGNLIEIDYIIGSSSSNGNESEKIKYAKEQLKDYDSSLKKDNKKTHRNNIINSMETHKKGKKIIANIELFSEGLNIKGINGIAFLDPKTSSYVSILQKIGRALRLDENNPDKVADVIIPINFEIDNLRINKNSLYQKNDYYRRFVNMLISMEKIDLKYKDRINIISSTSKSKIIKKSKKSKIEKLLEDTVKSSSNIKSLIKGTDVKSVLDEIQESFLDRSNDALLNRVISSISSGNFADTKLKQDFDKLQILIANYTLYKYLNLPYIDNDIKVKDFYTKDLNIEYLISILFKDIKNIKTSEKKLSNLLSYDFDNLETSLLEKLKKLEVREKKFRNDINNNIKKIEKIKIKVIKNYDIDWIENFLNLLLNNLVIEDTIKDNKDTILENINDNDNLDVYIESVKDGDFPMLSKYSLYRFISVNSIKSLNNDGKIEFYSNLDDDYMKYVKIKYEKELGTNNDFDVTYYMEDCDLKRNILYNRKYILDLIENYSIDAKSLRKNIKNFDF